LIFLIGDASAEAGGFEALILRSRPKVGVSKDEGARSVCAAMVRDASLRDAPHHEVFETRPAGAPQDEDGVGCGSSAASAIRLRSLPKL
jgi:hypothetical protein